MDKKYVVIGSWTDKANGNPLTRIAEINSGINKSGLPYEMANTDSREIIPGTYPVGTVLVANMTFTTQENVESQRSLKLGNPKQ